MHDRGSVAAPSRGPAWESIYDHPARVQSKYIVAGGYRTHYLEAGDLAGRPVVLIHGANFEFGMGVDRWYPTILPLSRAFRVIAVDELGGGGTDPPARLDDIGDVRVRADHVLAFIETMRISPVHLIGQSQGAWIAAYVALTRPALVDRLILVDSASLALPAGGMGASNIAPRFSDDFYPGTMVRKTLGTTRESLRAAVSSMVFDQSMLSDDFIDRLIPLALKWIPIWKEPWPRFWADGGRRNSQQYLLDGVHISELVHSLASPPLIIWGKNSVKGLENGMRLYQRIPDAQLHVFDKANHFVWLDQWRDFNSLAAWYLARS
jgi:2-hydroxy-6-oxonona-2,4-dienedioate hydrolase